MPKLIVRFRARVMWFRGVILFKWMSLWILGSGSGRLLECLWCVPHALSLSLFQGMTPEPKLRWFEECNTRDDRGSLRADEEEFGSAE